jgi:glycosyltransferase involved in cell wall biosynthesis
MKQRDVDVVYGSSPQLLAPLAAWAVAKARRVPFVLEIRDLWPQVLVDMGTLSTSSPAFRALTALEAFLYARAQRIVVMAEGSRDTLAARGIPMSKIIYIPNGADAADFEPSATRDQLRERYGFEKFTAIYAGAHGPANGLDLLLDAAQAVRDLPLEIILVGGGIEKAKLQADAARRGLGNVRFMDPVPKEEIPDLLNAADLGLHVLADVELFRTAVSPNKVFDYMAAGLPVLTNCPGLTSELVTSSGCGLAVAPTDLAAGLREALNGDFAGWGQRGTNWLAANQSRGSMATRLSRVLADVTSPSVLPK